MADVRGIPTDHPVLILNARAWFTGQPPQLLVEWALAVVGSAVLLVLVWTVYRLAMPILIERMAA